MGPERIYGSSNRRKSLVNIPLRARNFSQGKMQRMVEFCVHSDAIFSFHRRVGLILANRTTVVLLRAFHSGFQLLPGTWSLVPTLPYHASQPYLTTGMPSSPHVFKFDSPVNTPPLCFSPLTQCTTFPNLILAATQRSCCHVTSHILVLVRVMAPYSTGVSLLPHEARTCTT
jgi:hypothetical protein